jgi:TolB-like protein/Tfp pilus assembly protein PilF
MAIDPNKLTQFWQELKRRKVIRTVTVYAAASFVILELVSIIVDPLRLPDWTLAFVIVLLLVGFIISLILSWVYDITPEGLQKTVPAGKGAELDEIGTKKKTSLIGWIGLAVIVGFCMLYLTRNIKRSSEISKLDKSIAVLPFENWSVDEEHAHLGNALANEIITELYKVRDFHVISYTSAARYQDPGNLTIPQIGRELGANFIIEGTVERQGDEVSIHVQVIKAQDDDHLWANEFNGKWKDIFKIQDEIAFQVAENLRAVLTPEEIDEIDERPTLNPEAYDYYLRGLGIYETNIGSRTQEAMVWFKEAIRIDSSFALPWTYLSMCYWRTLQPYSPDYYKIKEANEKALELDPDLNIALVNMAEILDNEYDFEGAEQYIQLALEAGPDHYYVLRNAGRFYTLLGKHDLAISFCKRALKDDPSNPTALGYLYKGYFYGGHHELAWSGFNSEKHTIGRTNSIVYCQILLERGHLDSIFQIEGTELDKNALDFGQAAAYLMRGSEEEAKKYIQQLEEEKPPSYHYMIALAYAYGNDAMEVCNRIERSYEAHEIMLTYLKVDPAFQNYRAEPRVAAILEKMNYPG